MCNQQSFLFQYARCCSFFSRWTVVGVASDQAHSLISAISEALENITKEGKKILSIGTFGHLLMKYAPRLPDSFANVGSIRSKWGQISEPSRDVALEKPLRFVAGLPCAVRLVASLHNLDENDLRSLRIQVSYPDNTNGYFRPLARDISKEGNHVSSLVLISSLQAWSDAADVTLSLVLLSYSFQKDIFGNHLFHCLIHPVVLSQLQYNYGSILCQEPKGIGQC
ncbi:hypothetical protein DICVIV_03946 [Dictyocaulus viviparus]|uniref:Integrator complex subunit 4/Protein SIEL C-terminal Ig-like domain-containing protein n=1 Tax=Dictyocaulus viviparus TaxID=29172 RepID=A0A0D8Y5S0_DICVI|nr:hypothetical protein DICVIV_03946 [Dictyocaulus viviparus]